MREATHDATAATRGSAAHATPTRGEPDARDATEETPAPLQQDWTWRGKSWGRVCRHVLDYIAIDGLSSGRLLSGHIAELPGHRSDHRLVGQALSLATPSWNASERRTRGRPVPLRWSLPGNKTDDSRNARGGHGPLDVVPRDDRHHGHSAGRDPPRQRTPTTSPARATQRAGATPTRRRTNGGHGRRPKKNTTGAAGIQGRSSRRRPSSSCRTSEAEAGERPTWRRSCAICRTSSTPRTTRSTR